MRRALILVLAVVLVALAGCGGGSKKAASTGAATTVALKPVGPPLTKTQYEAKLRQIAKDVSSTLGTATSSSKKISKSDIDKVVTAVHAFTARLAIVNPPPAVKSLHLRLIGAMNDFADEFPGIADQFNKAKDPGAALAAFFAAKGIQELTALQKAFKDKGYNLNLNG